MVDVLAVRAMRVPEVHTSPSGAGGVRVGAMRDSVNWVDRNIVGIEPSRPA